MSRREDIHPTKNPDSYFRSLTERELRPKREKLAKLLERLGLEPVIPEGGYFMMANAKKFREKIQMSDLGGPDDAPWDRKCKIKLNYVCSGGPFLHLNKRRNRFVRKKSYKKGPCTKTGLQCKKWVTHGFHL